jgi:hypothetical protein
MSDNDMEVGRKNGIIGRFRHRSKRRLLVIGGIVTALVAVSGTALGYWTTSGTGSGTADVGTIPGVSVVQFGATGGLVPGGAAQPISFTIHNAGTSQYITSVAIVVSGVSGGGNAHGGCQATDFSIAGGTVAIGADLANGDHDYTSTGATISMANTGSNQDDCKGASVTLGFTAS